MLRSELFHVCIVVPEIEPAREHLTELLGVEWGPVRRFAFPYRRADGTDAVADDFTLCYSLGAPHLELVQARAGLAVGVQRALEPAPHRVSRRRHGCEQRGTSQRPRARWVRTASTPVRGPGMVVPPRRALGFRIEIIDARGIRFDGPPDARWDQRVRRSADGPF